MVARCGRCAFKENILCSAALAVPSAWKTDLAEAENIEVLPQTFILPWDNNCWFGVNS